MYKRIALLFVMPVVLLAGFLGLGIAQAAPAQAAVPAGSAERAMLTVAWRGEWAKLPYAEKQNICYVWNGGAQSFLLREAVRSFSTPQFRAYGITPADVRYVLRQELNRSC